MNIVIMQPLPAKLLAAKDWSQLFETEKLDSFIWSLPLRNDFVKTDILNKNAALCE